MISHLRAHKLEKSYRQKRVVDGVTIEIQSGEIIGLLGPNGAGKTTTFSLILGLVPQDGGRVDLDGEDITDYPMYLRAQKGICLLPQEASSFRTLSVEENLLAIMETRTAPEVQAGSLLAKTMRDFGLEKVAKSKAVTLSGGERRRLEIARAMMTQPRFMLLDEPFTGIDPLAIQDLQRIIRSLKESGLGVLITDHSVRETLKITDRAYIIDRGTILAQGTPADIVRSDKARKSYLGENFSLQ
ncbi:MAG: LPS export ABC transporter ATP-binding protein [Candidatus Aminicenantes bacterium]|nr:LPS export ABC transporter ATP-binding protein [Candidatus Aminicenantes bacterium]